MKRSSLSLLSSVVLAAVAVAPGAMAASPTVGSPDTVTADPPVPRPKAAPCVVSLFSDVRFTDFAPKPFAYSPPSACAGPWEKVVLEADFAVTAGRQFDRTATVWIGGANVYFGTTAEPSRSVARSWHVERDLTDYSALLEHPEAGEADLGTLVDGTYTGVLSGSARVLFYPRAQCGAASTAPDVVVPLSAGPTGGVVSLASGAASLSRTVTLPTNVERAYLDVFAQSQGADEFWYTCVPDAVASEAQTCGGTAYREAQVTIDGAPAGIAPIFPWIYTGGIDPRLWEPIPGVETLNLAPYRVDLSPFAGVLSDGQPHAVAVAVLGAEDHFAVTATLFAHLDHGARRVTGAVTTRTLSPSAPAVTQNLVKAADGSVKGDVDVSSTRRLVVAGYVRTSHGEVKTRVEQTVEFSSRQSFDITAKRSLQSILQTTRVASRTKTDGGGRHTDVVAGSEWPLTVAIESTTAPDGSSEQTTKIRQERRSGEVVTEGGYPTFFRVTSNAVAPTSTVTFDAKGAVTGAKGAESSQRFFSNDSRSGCYSRTLLARDGVLTHASEGEGCHR